VAAVNGLEGKVAIVTGGSPGIGEATVRRLCELGARTVIADVDVERGEAIVGDLTARGATAAFRRTDILAEDQIRGMVEFAVSQYGGLDILVNSAGIPRSVAPDCEVVDMTTAMWNLTLAGHLTSTMLACKYSLPPMIQGGGGSIVNVSSASSFDATVDLTAYSAAKAGVNQLTREVAATYGRDNVRCNAVVPGAILTPRGRKTMGREMFELFAAETPLPRLAEAVDVANAIVFFASGEAMMITGQTLVVDGGMMTKLPYWLPKMRASRGARFDELTAKYTDPSDD
jgi:NAD(P)-dependent dehydrogenase (short-subunit alcohol dehydrogenase family)